MYNKCKSSYTLPWKYYYNIKIDIQCLKQEAVQKELKISLCFAAATGCKPVSDKQTNV